MQSLARRVEKGGVLSCAGINAAAQPFLAALLRHRFPQRPMVLVTEGLRTQESAHQDLATWLALQAEVHNPKPKVQSPEAEPAGQDHSSRITHHVSRFTPHTPPALPPSPLAPQPLFYPAWEALPHEGTLPHADIISERLETLVALTQHATRNTQHVPLIVTSVAALLQRTFRAGAVRERTRTIMRGDRLDPLDLVEWLEEQGYEPEAQVTQKGEIALRGGILDVYPLISPWPVRLEFFGDEVESLRQFDPLTQISREEITAVTIPPAGELGLLKKSTVAALGTLLEYLPPETVLLLCEPELLAERAEEYAGQVPEGDPFFIPWETFLQEATGRGMTLLGVSDAEAGLVGLEAEGGADIDSPPAVHPPERAAIPHPAFRTPHLASLEAFRPLAERAPEPQVADMQRREFFAQMHRWLRQGYAAHVFCNNEGERQRFGEIWEECGLAQETRTAEGANPQAGQPAQLWTLDFRLWTHLGTLARGFLCDEAKLVVVTDAEIFGRYKVQRPRRLKSPHAQATRSALDIDFTELEEGDYVVHVQHGIGRYVRPAGAASGRRDKADRRDGG